MYLTRPPAAILYSSASNAEWRAICVTRAAVHLKNDRRNHRTFKSASRHLSSATTGTSVPTRDYNLPKSPARTRFAPSPTGYLHIGGLRTALYSYLLAKRTKGQFILRIEDTDQKRLVPDAEQRLREELTWAGLEWDEGPGTEGPHGPYRQSERNAIYRTHADELLSKGSAYRCFCSPQMTGAAKSAYSTSGCHQDCSSLPLDASSERAETGTTPFTVRLRQPRHKSRPTYPDLVYGSIKPLKWTLVAPEITMEDGGNRLASADTILVKSDGTPTYHFANVVDDHLMRITHVIRGAEWLGSTPIHYHIYSAFDWTPPSFAHVGLLVDQNGAKLSKRHQDVALDVRSLREQYSILPDALVNYLALLGWSNPNKGDMMSMATLIDNFDLKFSKGNVMIAMGKLWYLQRQHLARRCREVLSSSTELAQFTAEARRSFSQPMDSAFSPVSQLGDQEFSSYCASILRADSAAYSDPYSFTRRNRCFFVYDPADVPTSMSYYDEAGTITPEQLQKMTGKALETLCIDKTKAEGEPLDRRPEILEPAINQALLLETWRAVLDRSHALAGRSRSLTPSEFSCLQWHTPKAVASSLCDRLEENRELVFVKLMEDYKVVNVALRQYLRGRLSCGLPGPSVSKVMAILGLDESLRRLQVSLPPATPTSAADEESKPAAESKSNSS